MMNLESRVVSVMLLVWTLVVSATPPGAASILSGAPLAELPASRAALPVAQQAVTVVHLPFIGQHARSYLMPIGQIGGPTDAVAVLDGYAYIGIGPRLVILDIHNPDAPTVVGQSWFLIFSEVLDIAVAHEPPGSGATLAYVAAGERGFHIFDVSDPAHPRLLGSCYNGLNARGVAVAGSLAYVAGEPGGLHIIDVSDPTNPRWRGLYVTPGGASDVAVAGDLAYVADSSGLRIIDVSDPAQPIPRGHTTGGVMDVAVIGSLAYLANGNDGLQIIDVSNPTNPVRRGGYDTPGVAMSIAVAGDLAYIADSCGGLQIIDVSNPANPVHRGDYEAGVAGVAVAGSFAYITGGGAFRIIDVNDPTNPVFRGGYD
ncbi:MAG: hypothetical protein WBD79_19985, partial [Anaerolineae bacterium]